MLYSNEIRYIDAVQEQLTARFREDPTCDYALAEAIDTLAKVRRLLVDDYGTDGQDRESYSDTQDRESYTAD